jgi:adenylate cyclase
VSTSPTWPGSSGWGIFQDGDYYGRTVNLASRLAGAAEPGQTLVDAGVVRLVGDHDDLGFTRIGEVTLKGMNAPIEAYEAHAVFTS